MILCTSARALSDCAITMLSASLPLFGAAQQRGNVAEAARQAGCARQYAYVVRREDAAFAEAWDAALDEAADALLAGDLADDAEGLMEAVLDAVEDAETRAMSATQAAVDASDAKAKAQFAYTSAAMDAGNPPATMPDGSPTDVDALKADMVRAKALSTAASDALPVAEEYRDAAVAVARTAGRVVGPAERAFTAARKAARRARKASASADASGVPSAVEEAAKVGAENRGVVEANVARLRKALGVAERRPWSSGDEKLDGEASDVELDLDEL